jgi:PIN domain nuclease of toxin-antitoxin system
MRLLLDTLSDLPNLHRDPFDRLLICQALVDGLYLVTVDSAVTAYPVPTLPWPAS